MRTLIIKAASLVSCFLFLSAAVFAESEKPTTKVAILHTDFVSHSKIERLKQYAEDESVELIGLKSRSFSPAMLDGVDFLVADTPRMPDRQRLEEIVASLPEELEWVMLGGGPPRTSKQVNPRLNGMLMGYYLNGTTNNYHHFFRLIDAHAKSESIAGFPAAERIPTFGIYANEKTVSSLDAYLEQNQALASLPKVGFVISRNQIINQEFEMLNDLTDQAVASGLAPVIYYIDDQHGLEWPWKEEAPAVIVNMTHLQQGEKRKAEMERIDRPVIQTIHYRDGSIDDWRKSEVGIDQRSASVLLSTTETWGLTDPLVISAELEGEKVFIPQQLDLLFGRAHAYHRLQTKDNSDKSVAVMFWNAPAGAENISASNLNIPLSLQSIGRGLSEEGYSVPEFSEQQMIADAKKLLSGYYQPEQLKALYDEGYAVALPLRSYFIWYRNLPRETRQFIDDWWGHPMKYDGLVDIDGQPAFVFPLLKRGNLWLLPQPPRSGKVGHAIHSTVEPPSHLYLAAYLWLQREHNKGDLDALVHLGTHGSQEWTPGKARGLSKDDFPYLTLGDMPVLYPYIQDNSAEAIQAKRRGRATIISHQTPTFGPAGLYGEYVELNGLLGDYQNALPGSVRDELKASLIQKMNELNVIQDLGLSMDDLDNHFESVVVELEEHIDRLASSSVPLGLHVFGQPKTHSELLYTVLQQQGDELLEKFESDPKAYWKRFEGDFELLEQTAPMQWLEGVIQGSKETNSELMPFAEQSLVAYQKLANNGEMQALISGLNGGFIKAGSGGDPLRNPSTTSGTNLFGFDPAKVPSKQAYAAAEKELQNLFDAHLKENGHYPEKIAFSLWAGETQRHFGMLEAQVLRALGLEPVWDRGGNLVGLNIIPQSELGRPRIDVVIQATSVYRDQFDGFMLKLSTAIEELAMLDDGNTIAENSKALSEQLRELGYNNEQASMLSALRIFSNEPGDYGSGVNDLAIQSQDWEGDDALGKQFTNRLQYAYGTQVWGEKLGDTNLFESQLSKVDAAVMTRTSRLHGLLSTDHPFEYLGGLASAVRNASGKDPSLYVNDLRQSEGRTVTAGKFISEELNSRYLNPTWIKAMQGEGYAGALNMLDITNNLFGWQVTAPETVSDHQWESLSEVYIDDKHNLDINEWFEKHQPAAQMQIIERMLEAVRKGHWEADEERMKSLIERHQELEAMVEYHQTHAVTQEFIDQAAIGFGLSGNAGQASSSPMISGQVMKEIPAFEPPSLQDKQMFMLIAFVLLTISFGALKQHLIYRKV